MTPGSEKEEQEEVRDPIARNGRGTEIWEKEEEEERRRGGREEEAFCHVCFQACLMGE